MQKKQRRSYRMWSEAIVILGLFAQCAKNGWCANYICIYNYLLHTYSLS